MDHRKLSEVSDIASQIDSLISNLHGPTEGESAKPVTSPSKLFIQFSILTATTNLTFLFHLRISAKSDNSLDNPTVEDLPLEALTIGRSPAKVTFKMNRMPEPDLPLVRSDFIHDSVDSSDLMASVDDSSNSNSNDSANTVVTNPRSYKNMNLSQISERTEFNDTFRTQSEYHRSASGVLASVEESYNSKSASTSEETIPGFVPIKDRSLPKRSVLAHMFGCFFPIYRFA
jgi:hypothetical protein